VPLGGAAPSVINCRRDYFFFFGAAFLAAGFFFVATQFTSLQNERSITPRWKRAYFFFLAGFFAAAFFVAIRSSPPFL